MKKYERALKEQNQKHLNTNSKLKKNMNKLNQQTDGEASAHSIILHFNN